MLNAIHWLWRGERRVGAHHGDAAATRGKSLDLPVFNALVVDDLPVHRRLLAGMLKMLFPRVAVDEAGDGYQAQVLLRGGGYDIVLSDWTMPNMDGLQLAGWLRSGECPRCPFVLFSAHDVAEDVAPLFDMHGIDGYLIKPFDQTAMKQVVLAAIGVPEAVA